MSASARTAPQTKIPPLTEQEKPEIQTHPPTERTGDLVHDLGHYGGLHSEYRIEDKITLELTAVQSAVKLAKDVNLAQQTEHLVVRDILVDKDFRDGNNNEITTRRWIQPCSGHYEIEETDLQIYRINRSVDYHNKIYCFWGLRYVNRGPADDQPVTDSASVTIKDSTNTYDVWQTEGLDVNKEMYCFKPILIKNYVDFSIYVRPKFGSSGTFDNYQILGKVVEAAGNTVMGSPSKIVY